MSPAVLPPVQNEVDRMLKLLREKIRDQGFTQLKVQEALGWGRTYISQLFRKQKSLRFDQILSILHVIETPAPEFFSEFYGLAYAEGDGRFAGFRVFGAPHEGAGLSEAVVQLQQTNNALKRLLIDKGLIDAGEFEAAIQSQRSF